ncbi:hypothetical protein HQN90_28965 [Paenibacillus alba]|nr:hypothetical protein [Paenibacillus alba]
MKKEPLTPLCGVGGFFHVGWVRGGEDGLAGPGDSTSLRLFFGLMVGGGRVLGTLGLENSLTDESIGGF